MEALYIVGICVAILFALDYVNANANYEIAPEEKICPACGYYCLGKGGYGCIDKPKSGK